MRRITIALALLALIFCAGLFNARCFTRLTGEVTDLLTAAQTSVKAEDWRQAESFTRRALERWESKDFYLETTLRHSDTSHICITLYELLEYVEAREGADYAAVSAALLRRIDLLREGEGFSLKNLL